MALTVVTIPSDTQLKQHKALANLQQVRQEMKQAVLEREEEVDGLFVALLAGQHVLYLGEPGTGKSLLVDLLTGAVTGARRFKYLMTRFTTPEPIFGPPDLTALKAGKFEYVAQHTIRDCELAFLDEIFKANSAILNSLLTLVNERQFHNGTAGSETVPLMTLVGASNELPQGDDLSPFYDRFLLKYQVERIRDRNNLLTMLSQRPTVNSSLSLEDLDLLQTAVDDVDMSAYVPYHRDLILLLRENNFWISDRKARESLSLVAANAVLKGLKQQASLDDADILVHAFWQDPKDVPTLKKLIREFINPHEAAATELYDAAVIVYNNLMSAIANKDTASRKMYAGEAMTKLDDTVDALTKKIKEAGNGNGVGVDRLQEVKEKIEAMSSEAAALYIGRKVKFVED